MTSELKPCPFCGTSAKVKPAGIGCFAVYCDNLHRGVASSSKEKAAAEWNTRAVPDVPELGRWKLYAVGTPKMISAEDGEWCEYDQAAAVIAAKDAEIERLALNSTTWAENYYSARERAETAEAKLAQIEKQHDKDMEDVIDERDLFHDWADKLAHAIGGEEIGEHSNINNPWANALEIAEAAPVASDAALRAERDRYKQALVDITALNQPRTPMHEALSIARAALNPSEPRT